MEAFLQREWMDRGRRGTSHRHATGGTRAVRSILDRPCVAGNWTDAEQAVAAAVAGFARTSALGSWERQKILTAVAARLQSEQERFAQTIMREAGKPITAARAELIVPS